MMDANAFLTVNLRDVAIGRLEESVTDGLKSLQKGKFDPENIGAEAKRKLVFQKFLQEITSLAEKPNESFTRMLLKAAGIQHVRDKTLPDFQDLVGAAFREFVNVKILQRLDLTKASPATPVPDPTPPSAEPSRDHDLNLPSQTGLETFAFIRHRLAFLVHDESQFGAIEKIQYNNYKGKLVVYFERERRGRLFDFFEGGIRGPKYRFSFADIPEEVTTDKLVGSVIDAPLLQVFKRRVNGGEVAAAPSGIPPLAV
jgi:hypothetical protein